MRGASPGPVLAAVPGLAPPPAAVPALVAAPAPESAPAFTPEPAPAPESALVNAPPATAPQGPEPEVSQASVAPVEATALPGPEPVVAPDASPLTPPEAAPLPAPEVLPAAEPAALPPLPAADGTAAGAEPTLATPPATAPPEAPPPSAPLPLELPPLPPAEAEAKDPPPAAPLPAPAASPPATTTDSPDPAPATAPAPTAGAAAASEPPSKVDSQVVKTSADPAAIHAEGSPVKLTEAGHIAARVGDEVITLKELTEAVKEKLTKLPGGYKPTHQEIKMLTSQVLDMLIERVTITQEAKRELKKPEPLKLIYTVADKAWREEELPPLLRQEGVENEFKLKDKLAEKGVSLERMREIYRQEFLAKGFLDQKLKGKISVTVPEMRDYYNAHLDDFHRHELWTWREVVIELDKHPSRAEARTKADAALARLRRGDDFAQVAQAESEGPNRTKGGLWETAPDSYAVPAVNDAIKSLPIGQVSTVIEGPTSYHIVRVEARRPAGPASFAEVQDKIRRLVHRRKVETASNAFLDKLRKQTVVTTIFDKTDFAPSATRSSAPTDAAVTPTSGSGR
jgi:peptidyl-prolyl cis-trans isomerase SurA